jgi:hypothetical protein
MPAPSDDAIARALSALPTTTVGAAVATRTPIHTVYGGAHLFKHDTAQKLGKTALATLNDFAPDGLLLARALELPGHRDLPTERDDVLILQEAHARDARALAAKNHPAWLALEVHARVRAKLAREPVEDLRIDFEDGYGHRPAAEEDGHVDAAAREVALGLERGTLPPFLGVRPKSLCPETRERAVRTLVRFFSALNDAAPGRLPPAFVVTLPKVSRPDEVAALSSLLEAIEAANGLAPASIGIELMIETPASVIAPSGTVAVPSLVAAGRGRVRSVHVGAYDLTASLDVAAVHQRLSHPAADVTRMLLSLALAGTGVAVSDGATTELPVGLHRGAAPGTDAFESNRLAVYRGWRLAHRDIAHALSQGIYQGWDLHPAQLVSRYASVYAFFLAGEAAEGTRLQAFVDAAARARSHGSTFDDAATGQGLLAYFVRGLAAGAFLEAEVTARTGLRPDELRARSFAEIVRARAAT